MVNIPQTTRPPMRTSDLDKLNRTTGTGQSLQDLRRPASDKAAPPQPGRVSPPPPARTAPPQPARTAPPPNRAPGTAAPPARPVPSRPHPPASGRLLQKGQKVSLSQLAPALEQVDVGLGWDLAPGSHGYELDVEAFLLGPEGRVPGDDWFVFYNQPASPDGAVRLLDTPANTPGDDGVIQVDLRRLSPQVARIAFIVTINEARERGQHFGGVSAAYARVTDRASRRELVRFPLSDYYTNVFSMVVGELYRYKDEWRFNPVGSGTGDDLAGLCRRYGVDV